MTSATRIRSSNGSNLKIVRTIIDVPDGETVETVYFTVKLKKPYPDSAAVIAKTIDESSTLGTGLLSNASPPNGTASLEVHITTSDWAAMTAETLYYFDIKAVNSSGGIEVIETGFIILSQEITQHD